MPIAEQLREAAKVSKAWPYEEARKLLKRYPDGPGDKAIVFETGYGPSGLPHLGTFQEVARTQMVRHALAEMVDWPSRSKPWLTEPEAPRLPPFFEKAVRMLVAVRLRLSVSASTISATPPGPKPS